MDIEKMIDVYTEEYQWLQLHSDNTEHKCVKGNLTGQSDTLRRVIKDLRNLKKKDE